MLADVNMPEDSTAKSGAWDADLAGDPGSGELPDIVELRPEEAVRTKPNAQCLIHFCSQIVTCVPCQSFCTDSGALWLQSGPLQVCITYCIPQGAVLQCAVLRWNLVDPYGTNQGLQVEPCVLSDLSAMQAAILPAAPTAEQVQFCSGDASTLWQRLGVSLLLTLVTLKTTALAAGSFTFPLWYPSLRAALRNRSIKGKYRCSPALIEGRISRSECLALSHTRPPCLQLCEHF